MNIPRCSTSRFLFSLTLLWLAMFIMSAPFSLPGSTASAADIILKKKPPVQAEEDDTDGDEDEPASRESSNGNSELQGFIEYENFTGTYPHQAFRDIVKKNEIRNNVSFRTGSDNFYFAMNSNIYIHDYAHDPAVYRNGTTRGSSFEINFNKLYYNAEFSFVRLRAGNQIYQWGTADVFNPTSYFNPMDLREALFKDQDELRQGVPSLSSLFFIGDDTLELVIVPLHVPALLPEKNTFWELRYEEEGYPINIAASRPMKPDIKNVAVGLQYYKNILSTDVNISAYYGPDTEPLFRPIGTIAIPNEPLAVDVHPEYHTTVKTGLALSRGWYDFVFQFEMAYSPLKTGVVDQDYSGGQIPQFPFETRTFHALYTTAGFNYMIPMTKFFEGHEGDSVLTMEYSRPTFFSHNIMDPMLGDILVIRIEDTFINGRLKVLVTGIVDITEKGTIIMPEVQYRFPMGLSINASYAFIHGRERSMIGLYTDNDFIRMRVRYEYKM